MNRLKRAVRELLNQPQPKTRIASGGSQQNYFTQRDRNKELLKKYGTIYQQGGIVSEAVDCYAMFCLSGGWTLEGGDAHVKKVQEFLDYIDFDSIVWEGITDAIVFGDGFQENILSIGGDLAGLVTRSAPTFDIIYDEFGTISGYEQYISNDFGIEYKIPLKPNQITHLQFFRLGGSLYGQSLIGRAYDDIMRDTKTAESTAVAIERHGFRKYHVKVGLEGEDIPSEVLTNISKEFQKLNTKNDMVTSHDVEISNIDPGGLDKIDTYSDISLMRMAAAMGVPEELLGLRRGSTDATASTRIDVFFRKIATLQRKISRCYERNVFDVITGMPGEVKLVFRDINPSDEAQKAKWISEIMKATPIDPFLVLPQTWIKEQFNIDPDAYEDEDPMEKYIDDEGVPDETEQNDKAGTNPDEDITK